VSVPDALWGKPEVDALQGLLSGPHGPAVRVDRWERLEPWAVARVWVDGGSALPGSVVVKWVPHGQRETRTASWRLRTELAALRFLEQDIGADLAPRVIAADASAGFFVLEDLAPRVSLDQLLRRDGAAPHAGRLAAFARARAALSAATAGRAETYNARRAEPAPDPAVRLAADWQEAIDHAVALDVPTTGQVNRELAKAAGELAAPGPFSALSNRDAEANNVLLHASGPADARLIDFEFAGYTHALADAVCLYVPGPAWLTVGDPTTTGLADAYRRALALGIPDAEDDRRYGDGLAAASVSWGLVRLRRFALLESRPPGDPSRLQLISTLEAAARTAESYRALPHLTGWIRRIAATLRRRWPDADQDFDDPARFPPYRARHNPEPAQGD
jgi:aminoglycoside/choline kinase family phosphotransferase